MTLLEKLYAFYGISVDDRRELVHDVIFINDFYIVFLYIFYRVALSCSL